MLKFRSLEQFFSKTMEVGLIRPPAVYSSQIEPQTTKKVKGQGGTPREVPLLVRMVIQLSIKGWMTSLGVQITKRIKDSGERSAIQAGKLLLHVCISLMFRRRGKVERRFRTYTHDHGCPLCVPIHMRRERVQDKTNQSLRSYPRSHQLKGIRKGQNYILRKNLFWLKESLALQPARFRAQQNKFDIFT